MSLFNNQTLAEKMGYVSPFGKKSIFAENKQAEKPKKLIINSCSVSLEKGIFLVKVSIALENLTAKYATITAYSLDSSTPKPLAVEMLVTKNGTLNVVLKIPLAQLKELDKKKEMKEFKIQVQAFCDGLEAKSGVMGLKENITEKKIGKITDKKAEAIKKWVKSKRISNEGIEFIASCEGGYKQFVYDASKTNNKGQAKFDKNGKIIGDADWTIGFGHKLTKEEIENKTFTSKGISEAEALEIYKKQLPDFENKINELISGDKLTQNQFDALTSFLYQQGKNNDSIKVVIKSIEDGDIDKAAKDIKNTGGVKFRREAESVVFCDSIYLPSDYYENKNFYKKTEKANYERLKDPIIW